MTTITGTGFVSAADMAVLTEWMHGDPERDRAEVNRAREMSRLSGMEVRQDLSMFDIEWSPVYWYASDVPVAWENAAGERRPGPDYPSSQ